MATSIYFHAKVANLQLSTAFRIHSCQENMISIESKLSKKNLHSRSFLMLQLKQNEQ